MKKKSISKVLAIMLSCALCIPSNAVYVYAQPNSNEVESEYENEELISDYEESVPREIHEDESETEEPERADADIESESEIEETKSDDIEENKDANEQDEQDFAAINSDILEEYNAHIMQLKEDLKGGLKNVLAGLSSSEAEISENNESYTSDDISEVCIGSRLDYIKNYLVANGVKTDDIYALTLNLDDYNDYNVTYSMKYDSVNDKVEFRILFRNTSSTGIVSDSETYFYAEDNAVNQRIFSSFKTESSPYLSYSAYADVIPAELKEEEDIDFTIELADPEDMRSEYDQNADNNGSLLLELLLVGMDTWFDVLYDSDVTIGNFGYSLYKAPATNHIWGEPVTDEGREYRTCAVCNETDELEQIEDWEYDAVTGIKWNISEGVLTVNYAGFLEYDSAPWENASEDITKLILLEGITGFSEDVTYDLPNLTEIKIPASCTNTEDVWATFDFNDKLEKIDVSSGNAKFLSVNGVLYNESGEKLLFYPHNRPGEVFTLPDACIEIDDLYSNKVRELNLGSNLETINGYVGGENVTVIRIPATLQNIGGAVFDVTEKLTNIIIDENNPYLCYENYALLSKDKKTIYEVMPCNNTTYEIPDTVEEIVSGAFFNDNKIQNLIIPKNVKKIGSGAFARMQKIEKICLLSTTAQFMGMPFSITDKDEEGTFYVPNEYSKTLVEGILAKCNIKNVKLIVDTALDAPGDERLEEEPNDLFETAMNIEMGEKVLASIGGNNRFDYYSVYFEREYAQTIYIENYDNINASVMIYDESKRIQEILKADEFKYDADSNSYYSTFATKFTGKHYIYFSTLSSKEAPYGIMYTNNSNDTSLDEEVAIEEAKRYPGTVNVYPENMNKLRNYIKKNGEYEYDRDFGRRSYTISEKRNTFRGDMEYGLEYDIDSDGTEWIRFTVYKYHNGFAGSYYPGERLYFLWVSDNKTEFSANYIDYDYVLGSWCKTGLRTDIDITNADYGKIDCNFKFYSKNYSDIYDSEQIRKNATVMYKDGISKWEDFLERAMGQEGFIFSDMLKEGGGRELPPYEEDDDEGDDKDNKDKYSVYYDDQRTDISGCMIANIKAKVYDGKAYTPTPKVTIRVNGKNKNLVYGTDYRLLYANNTNAGKGTVWIIGIGNYKGSKSKTFFINKKNIGKLTKVAGSIAMDDTLAEPIGIYDGTKLLTKGDDYDYVITENDVSRKGTAKIEVSALQESNYTGTAVVKVPVIDDEYKTMIEADDIELDATEYNYDGRPHTPGVTVTIDGEELEKKNYSVTYKNNKNRGKAYVIVKGKGKLYTGTAIAFFDIVTPTGNTGFDSVVVNKGKNVTYTGKLQKPKVVVTMNGKKLAVNKDYTLEYTNHFNAGEGKVKVTGIGNYEGLSNSANFTIEQRLIKKASISAKSSNNYTVKYAGKVLVEGIDYEVELEEISGTNKVNLKFKGLKNFSGEITKKKVKK